MALTPTSTFVGAARRLIDIDLPRIAHTIQVGEDELHAFMDVEAAGRGFDGVGRPKMLFEPHVFYRNLKGAERDEAVRQGLAYPKWKKGYPADSYPRLKAAMKINLEAACRAASWGLSQILGENAGKAGYRTAEAMAEAFMESEAVQLEATVRLLIAWRLDDDLRALAALKRPTVPEDCIAIARTWNGPAYAENDYHTKMAKAHNKWRGIKDTPWSPDDEKEQPVAQTPVATDPYEKLYTGGPHDELKNIQAQLRAAGYPEVGNFDGKYGLRTAGAILSFRRANELPLTDKIDDAFLAKLAISKDRPVSVARETVTATDLVKKGDETVKNGIQIAELGKWAAILAPLLGVTNGVLTAQEIPDRINDAKLLVTTLMPVLPYLAVGVGGYFAWKYGRKIVADTIWDYRNGRKL